MGETLISIKPTYLIALLLTTAVPGWGSEESSVTTQEISRLYKESQALFAEAKEVKSLERLLRTLDRADQASRLAREKLQGYLAATSAEQRMKNRIAYSLMEDAAFIRDLKADLGLAEIDSIESYRTLRRSLLQDPGQKQYVIRMDLQILMTVERRSLSKANITTR